MWLLIVIPISLTILGYLYWKKRNTQAQVEKQFEQIMLLRQLMQFIRYHRRHCHQHITAKKTQNEMSESVNTQSHIVKETLTVLIHQADMNHKPMFRILRQDIQALFIDWRTYTLQRSQAVHARIIRHIMYLIDDVISAILLKSEKDTTFEHYQSAWPITLNALDNLNRFRWTIEHYPLDSKSYPRELEMHVKMIQRRLSQISTISKKKPPTWPIEKLMENFSAIPLHNVKDEKVKAALYTYSFQMSDTIFDYFDLILSDIADDLCVPAPSLTTKLLYPDHY